MVWHVAKRGQGKIHLYHELEIDLRNTDMTAHGKKLNIWQTEDWIEQSQIDYAMIKAIPPFISMYVDTTLGRWSAFWDTNQHQMKNTQLVCGD